MTKTQRVFLPYVTSVAQESKCKAPRSNLLLESITRASSQAYNKAYLLLLGNFEASAFKNLPFIVIFVHACWACQRQMVHMGEVKFCFYRLYVHFNILQMSQASWTY